VEESSVEIARLRKVVEEEGNKNSVLQVENSELKGEKEKVEAELDKNFEDTLELINQSFFQAVHQAHVLYNDPPLSDDFDPKMKVYEGRILPREEGRALRSAIEPTPTEDVEDEDEDEVFSLYVFSLEARV